MFWYVLSVHPLIYISRCNLILMFLDTVCSYFGTILEIRPVYLSCYRLLFFISDKFPDISSVMYGCSDIFLPHTDRLVGIFHPFHVPVPPALPTQFYVLLPRRYCILCVPTSLFSLIFFARVFFILFYRSMKLRFVFSYRLAGCLFSSLL